MLLIINGTRARLSERRGLGSAGSGDAAITRPGWRLHRLPQHFRAEALGGVVEGNGGAGGGWLAAAALPGPRHLPVSGEPPARQGWGCCRGTAGSLRRRGSPSLGEVHGVPGGDTGGGPVGTVVAWWGQRPTLWGQAPRGWAPGANLSALLRPTGGGRGTPTCACAPAFTGWGRFSSSVISLTSFLPPLGSGVPKVSPRFPGSGLCPWPRLVPTAGVGAGAEGDAGGNYSPGSATKGSGVPGVLTPPCAGSAPTPGCCRVRPQEQIAGKGAEPRFLLLL